MGRFLLEGPRVDRGRYRKTDPQRNIVGNATTKVPDFILTGFDIGPIWIECKNYREWLYPDHTEIRELIAVALDANMTPLLIARRIHYTTITNLLEPAGILAHESLYQYYPSSEMLPRIADRVGRKFRQNKTALRDFVEGEINLAQLYNAIESPAAENWIDRDLEQFDEF